MDSSFSIESTRWDVWRHELRDLGNGYEQLVRTSLAGVVEDDGLGVFTVQCTECGKPLGDPKLGPDHGYGHPAKAYASRAGAKAALVRHYARDHVE